MQDKKVIDVSDADIIKYNGDYYGLKQLKWAHDGYLGYNDRLINAKSLDELKKEDCLIAGYIEGVATTLYLQVLDQLKNNYNKQDILKYIIKLLKGQINDANN